MALVSMEQAKAHLRVRSSAADEDIWFKVEQASALVLKHLDTGAHKRAVIASSSVANPTVITTDEAHGFINGETVTIADHEDSAPAISGPYVVSSVTEFSFTIPVNVTTGGTGGTAIVPWSETTAPLEVQAATLLVLTYLFAHRGDEMSESAAIWQAIERTLVGYRASAVA